MIVQLDQPAKSQRRQNPMHGGLRQAELLGDLGDPQRGGIGFGEKREHVGSTLDGRGRLARGFRRTAAQRLGSLH
ncbi:hypothetical protein [Streptosporangium sp. CA-115845]|uniref:hypothetical protein n=1 Tax=Streptosporangium sp. CA-115845 TaxID=3240071 RepID=UPI003D90F48A